MKLPKLPRNLGYDVCGFPMPGWNPMRGVGIPERFFVTHYDLDHLKAFGGGTLLCAEWLQKPLERIYRGIPIEIETYPRDLCIDTWHPRETERQRVRTSGYIYGDLLVIPESIHALKFLKDYDPKFAVIVFFKQPRSHAQPYVSPDRLRELCDHAYYADVSTMESYRPWVIPQCAPSIQDVKDAPDRWIFSPFSEFFGCHTKF
jgi:hypothetical protein